MNTNSVDKRQDTTLPVLTIRDGRPVTTSLDVARVFGKQHKHVLDAIRCIDLPAEFTEPNFRLSEYTDPTGRNLPCYDLTRDGFTFLVMGFTGKEANLWKMRYIEAFNAMEAKLLKQKGIRSAKYFVNYAATASGMVFSGRSEGAVCPWV